VGFLNEGSLKFLKYFSSSRKCLSGAGSLFKERIPPVYLTGGKQKQILILNPRIKQNLWK